MMLLLVLAITATGAVVGPSAVELASAINAAPGVAGTISFRTDTIQSVRCRPFEEEPTEYRCRFRAWDAAGRWKQRSAIVAEDRTGWVLLSLD